MMRRVLTIFIVLLGVTCANAQAVWISPDGYCQYAVIEFGNTGADELKLADRHRSSLDFIAYLIDQHKTKIETQEYQVWVESYVGNQDKDFAANRALARRMSNVVKSHIILNDGLTEANFKTRNYCGTYGGQSGITVVVIGMRYPVEEIVPKQRIFYDQMNSDEVEYIEFDVTPDSLNTQKVISSIGVDTLPVLYPNFQIMTFGDEVSADVQSEQNVNPSGASYADHGVIGDDTFGAPRSSKTPANEPSERSVDGNLSFDNIIIQNKKDNTSIEIPKLIDDDSFNEPGLPKLWSTDDQHNSTQSRSSIAAVASGVASLVSTPGAFSTIVKVSPAKNPIAFAGYGQRATSVAQKSKHQREINKQIDQQLRQQKEQQRQDELLAKEQAKQQKIDEKAIDKSSNKYNKSHGTGSAQMSASSSGVVTGSDLTNSNAPGSAATGATIMTFDRATASTASATPGVDDKSKTSADPNQPSAIDEDPQPMPFAPLSSFGADRDNHMVVTAPTTTKKRGQKSQSLDGKSIEESMNQAILAEQKMAERDQRVKKEQAVREIIQKNKLERIRAVQLSKGRFAVAGIGLNVLSSAALIPSVQLDSYFSDRFSVAAEWYYSKWNFSPNNVFNLSMGSLELRYFCTGKKKAFDGFYVGLYGAVGEYDFRWGSVDGRQSQFLNVGLSVGYVLPLGKSGFYFEAGISGGYVTEKIEKYMRFENNYVRLNEKFTNSTIFAPTKIKLSIIYRIFNQKR